VSPGRVCKDHPQVSAVVVCASCRRFLCDACFRFRVANSPACARCAYEVVTRPKRRRSLAIAFALTTWGAILWAAWHFETKDADLWIYVAIAIAGLAGGIIIAWPTFSEAMEVGRREDEEAPTEQVVIEGGGSPFRAHARRIVLAASPKVSGGATALIVGVSLAGAAVLLPFSLHLPRWIETELVLGAWWLIVTVTLVVLLYRGFRLKDDWVYFAPWDVPMPHSTADGSSAKSPKPKASGGCDSGIGGCAPDGCGDGCSAADGEGILIVIALAVVAIALFGAMWIFVEFALPMFFLLMYTLIHRAIARVANDKNGCENELLRSIGYGALWATVYLTPLIAATWALHRFVPSLR
jgi:hypothetical protein